MKNPKLSLLASAAACWCLSLALPGSAFGNIIFGGGGIDTDLRFSYSGGGLPTVKWNTASGALQLQQSDSLGTQAQWAPAARARAGADGYWAAAGSATADRAFYRLIPAPLPILPPEGVHLVMDGSLFRLEWESMPEASGFVAYVGLTPNAGPTEYVKKTPLGQTNSLIIEGLTAGQLYYVTIAAVNGIGEGPSTPVQAAVFGPNGSVSGRVVRSFSRGEGQTFDVEVEGLEVTLVAAGSPAGGAAPGLPMHATTNAQGSVYFPHVPVGQYFASWSFDGQPGGSSTPLTVTPTGASLDPLIINPGPPPPLGTALLGTLALSTGDAPRIDLDDFGVHARGQIQLLGKDGSRFTTQPDRGGRWAINGLPPGGWPFTVRGTYQGLVTTTQAALGTTQGAPFVPVVFPQQIPRVTRITAMQGGKEATTITPDQPVTFQVDFENPDQLPIAPRWTAEFGGENIKADGLNPVFTFPDAPGSQPGPATGDSLDSGLVKFRFNLSGYLGAISSIDIAVVNWVKFLGCYSGRVGVWDPTNPGVITGAHPASVTVNSSFLPATTTTSSNFGGYFEVNRDPVTKAPYLLRAEKPGYMRFLWPFETKLPLEAQFCLVPAETFNTITPTLKSRVITHAASGATLVMPVGAVQTYGGASYGGPLVIQMASFDPLVRHPLPPGAELRSGATRQAVELMGAVWFDIQDGSGNPLQLTAAATLHVPVNGSSGWPASFAACHQSETTGYFEPAGSAVITGTPGYYSMTPYFRGGLNIACRTHALNELVFEANRTINYPFDILIGKSIFPVTIQSFCRNSLGHITSPYAVPIGVDAIDLRHAPGMYFSNPAAAVMPVEPFNLPVIVRRNITPSTAPLVLPLVAAQWVHLSLSDNAPEIAPAIPSLNSAGHFLSRHTSTAADTSSYYAKINAPATLTAWRTLNGLPASFGAPLSGVPADDYATTYYYNLGDLGFARAQTMRIKVGCDGQKDIAYAVTNYETLEDARCGRGAVATVCMDYSRRTDAGEIASSRHTRFYVYGSNNLLLDCANLDGAGLKCVPNLCVICHSGNEYVAGGTANLGSRFIPFDLESYTYHPKFGTQKPEFARMNRGVTLTNTSLALTNLITGWYANSNPVLNNAVFNHAYVPSAAGVSWSGSPAQSTLYSQVFKNSCRVCHISREGVGYQMNEYADFPGLPPYPVCTSYQMAHTQRTWGVLWGSRASVHLGFAVPDQPTLLNCP